MDKQSLFLARARNKAEKILAEIEELSSQQFLPIVGPVKGKVLAKEIQKKKPKRILEIGALVGYSAILMGSHLPESGKIISVEINPELAKIARENLKRAGLADKIEVVVGDALEVLPTLAGPFDFVFIDAAKKEYLDYLKLVEEKLSPDAVVVADNAKVFAEAMADYLHYVRNSVKYKSQFIDCGQDGLEISTLV